MALDNTGPGIIWSDLMENSVILVEFCSATGAPCGHESACPIYNAASDFECQHWPR